MIAQWYHDDLRLETRETWVQLETLQACSGHLTTRSPDSDVLVRYTGDINLRYQEALHWRRKWTKGGCSLRLIEGYSCVTALQRQSLP